MAWVLSFPACLPAKSHPYLCLKPPDVSSDGWKQDQDWIHRWSQHHCPWFLEAAWRASFLLHQQVSWWPHVDMKDSFCCIQHKAPFPKLLLWFLYFPTLLPLTLFLFFLLLFLFFLELYYGIIYLTKFTHFKSMRRPQVYQEASSPHFHLSSLLLPPSRFSL